MPFRVRSMVEADVERVLAIASSLQEAPHWPEAIYRVALAGESSGRRLALVAEVVSQACPDERALRGEGPALHLFAEIGTVVGFLVASFPAPPEAELESIAVAAEAQRQGVARRLLDELQAQLKPMGITEVLLEVRASNGAACAAYAAAGFRQEGRRPRYYADPVEDALLLRLQLR